MFFKIIKPNFRIILLLVGWTVSYSNANLESESSEEFTFGKK